MLRTIGLQVTAILTLASVSSASVGPVSTLAQEIGLTPDVFALAGVSAEQLETALDNLDEAEEQRTALATSRAAVNAVTAALSAAIEQYGLNPSDSTDATALREAKLAVAGARATLITAETNLRTATLQGLSSETRAAIAQVVANAGRAVPAEFKVLSLDHAAWRTLETALAAERRCARTGSDVPTNLASALSEARNAGAVATAHSRLQNALQTLRGVFAEH